MTFDFVRDNWRGETPLWIVYWFYGVLGSFALGGIIAMAATSGWLGPAGTTLALLAGAAYTAWILVSVWRCADNIVGEPLGISRETWAVLARSLTVVWAINVVGLSAILFQSALHN